MFGIFTKQINKKRLHPVLVSTLKKASLETNLDESNEGQDLIMSSLKLTDLAANLLVKKNGWDIEAINQHCRPEVVAAFICFYGYLSISPEKSETLKILKQGIRTALYSVGIYDGNAPIPRIEISIIIAMAKEARSRNMDIDETLGLKLDLG